MIEAWHFTAETLRDGRALPAIGETLRHDGPLVPCKSGLHASVRIIDALDYAPGPIIHRVRLSGEIIAHKNDKLVARERTILWSHDATQTLRDFARSQASSVLHLWDAPKAVRDFLETGDEALRRAAQDAASHAALGAAWEAQDAAWKAVGGTACTGARLVMWVWSTARAAAHAAAWGAAWDAPWDAANKKLELMICESANQRLA